MADIQPPDFETRMAIIKNKAEQYDFSIPDEIVEFFAQEVKNNVRQLESAVKKIKSLCLLSNAKPNLNPPKGDFVASKNPAFPEGERWLMKC